MNQYFRPILKDQGLLKYMNTRKQRLPGGVLFVCFWPCLVAWGILVSRLLPALEAWSLTTEPPGKFPWGNILEVVNIPFAKSPLMLTSYPNITKLKNSPPYKNIIKCVDQFGFHLVFPRMNLFCFRSIPPSHFAFSCSLQLISSSFVSLISWRN